MLVGWLLVFIKENSCGTSLPPLEMINTSAEVCLFGTLSDRRLYGNLDCYN